MFFNINKKTEKNKLYQNFSFYMKVLAIYIHVIQMWQMNCMNSIIGYFGIDSYQFHECSAMDVFKSSIMSGLFA